MEFVVVPHLLARPDQTEGIAHAAGHRGARTELAEVQAQRKVRIEVGQIEPVAVRARIGRGGLTGQRIAPVALIRRPVADRGPYFDLFAGLAGNDVDDGSHRIGAVEHRRSAAHHLDAGDARKRNPAEVDVAVGLAGQAFPVEQKKHVARIESLERQRGAVPGLMELDAGQLALQGLLQRDRPAALDVAGGNHTGDDRRSLQRQGRPRSRHHHFVHPAGEAVAYRSVPGRRARRRCQSDRPAHQAPDRLFHLRHTLFRLNRCKATFFLLHNMHFLLPVRNDQTPRPPRRRRLDRARLFPLPRNLPGPKPSGTSGERIRPVIQPGHDGREARQTPRRRTLPQRMPADGGESRTKERTSPSARRCPFPVPTDGRQPAAPYSYVASRINGRKRPSPPRRRPTISGRRSPFLR